MSEHFPAKAQDTSDTPGETYTPGSELESSNKAVGDMTPEQIEFNRVVDHLKNEIISAVRGELDDVRDKNRELQDKVAELTAYIIKERNDIRKDPETAEKENAADSSYGASPYGEPKQDPKSPEGVVPEPEKEKTAEDFKDLNPSEAHRMVLLASGKVFEKDNELIVDRPDPLVDLRADLLKDPEAGVRGKIKRGLNKFSEWMSLKQNKKYVRRTSAEEQKQQHEQLMARNTEIANMTDNELRDYVEHCRDAVKFYEKVEGEQREVYGSQYDAAVARFGIDRSGEIAFKPIRRLTYKQEEAVFADGSKSVVSRPYTEIITAEDVANAFREPNQDEAVSDHDKSLLDDVMSRTSEYANLNARRAKSFRSSEKRAEEASKIYETRDHLIEARANAWRISGMSKEEVARKKNASLVMLDAVANYETNKAMDKTLSSKMGDQLRKHPYVAAALTAGVVIALGLSTKGIVENTLNGTVDPAHGLAFLGMAGVKGKMAYERNTQHRLDGIDSDEAFQSSANNNTSFSEEIRLANEAMLTGKNRDNRKNVGAATLSTAAYAATGGLLATGVGAVAHGVSELAGSHDGNGGALHHVAEDKPDKGGNGSHDADAVSVETEPKFALVDYVKANYVRYGENGQPDYSHKFNMFAFDEPTPAGMPAEDAMADQISDGRYNPEQTATMTHLLTDEQRAELGIQNMNENTQELADRLHDNELRDRFMDMIESNKEQGTLGARTSELTGTYYNYGLQPVYDEAGKVVSTKLVYEVHELQNEPVTILKGPDGSEEMWLNRCGNKVELAPPANIPLAPSVTEVYVPPATPEHITPPPTKPDEPGTPDKPDEPDQPEKPDEPEKPTPKSDNPDDWTPDGNKPVVDPTTTPGEQAPPAVEDPGSSASEGGEAPAAETEIVAPGADTQPTPTPNPQPQQPVVDVTGPSPSTTPSGSEVTDPTPVQQPQPVQTEEVGKPQ